MEFKGVFLGFTWSYTSGQNTPTYNVPESRRAMGSDPQESYRRGDKNSSLILAEISKDYAGHEL